MRKALPLFLISIVASLAGCGPQEVKYPPVTKDPNKSGIPGVPNSANIPDKAKEAMKGLNGAKK